MGNESIRKIKWKEINMVTNRETGTTKYKNNEGIMNVKKNIR